MNFFKQTYRWLMMPWRGLSFIYGSRRSRKWIKKNNKLQDPNHHDYTKRWNYLVKKSKTFIKLVGINLEIINEDEKPKGAYLLITNHVSNFDPFYIITALGEESPTTSIAKSNLQYSKIKGYFQAAESFFVYSNEPRKSLNNFNNAGKWAKNNKRGVVIFPEGKRNWDGEMSDFSAASFKLSHKYYLPIYPVSIVGNVEARKWYNFNFRTVKVIFHKPIKASESAKFTTTKLAEKVQAIIKKDLDDYEKQFEGKELEKRIAYKKKLKEKENKFSKKLEIQNKKIAKKENKKRN